jgi:hypothetical protein
LFEELLELWDDIVSSVVVEEVKLDEVNGSLEVKCLKVMRLKERGSEKEVRYK